MVPHCEAPNMKFFIAGPSCLNFAIILQWNMMCAMFTRKECLAMVLPSKATINC